MNEKGFVGFTQIIETRFSVNRIYKAVLGAFTVADEEKITFPANLRQGVPFVTTELALFFRGDDFGHRCLQNVAEEIIRFDEMVAGIQVAIVL